MTVYVTMLSIISSCYRYICNYLSMLSIILTSPVVVVAVVISQRHRSQESLIRRRDQSKDTLVIIA